MSIGTIDRTPPPFFRQGPSALTKLILCSAMAVFLMVADNRFMLAKELRAAVATALYYPEQVLLVPVQAVERGGDYLQGLQRAVVKEEAAKRALVRQSERSLRLEELQTENTRLRELLEMRPALEVRSQAAQVLYEAPDPYSRKLIIDRGATNGIKVSSPVINEQGVLGQVTRVYPLSCEVTLLIDKDAAIPVLNTRTQTRGLVFGGVIPAGMEMRFVANSADVQVGDVFTTSGLDGVYPAGLPVAKVVSVDRKADSGFANIVLLPNARPDGVRHLLVLEPTGVQMPPRPDPKASAPKTSALKASAPNLTAPKASDPSALAPPTPLTAASEPQVPVAASSSMLKASTPKTSASKASIPHPSISKGEGN
jgi:rod shape-determining protein MreC